MRVMASVLAALLVPQAGPTFRTNVERVQVDVSVTRDGRPVSGLSASDFVLTDNGDPQDLESAVLEDVPLSVQLVLDTSASVSGERLTHLVAAGRGLLAALTPRDWAGLITFSNVVEIRSRLTHDFAAVGRAIDGVRGAGGTSLRDALQIAVDVSPPAGTRALVLVFTDGDDTMSWLTEAEILDSARRVGAVVHVVQVSGVRSSTAASSLARDLADVAGGRVWSASSTRDLGQLFTRALAEMRARYLLTFAPRRQGVPGWHELDVRVRNRRAEIKSRRSYFVVEPPRTPEAGSPASPGTQDRARPGLPTADASIVGATRYPRAGDRTHPPAESRSRTVRYHDRSIPENAPAGA